MALTPADVHNVAFSRARIGKRGYSEQEVDLFIDLVEEELTRHIEEDTELRSRIAELRKREAEVAQQHAALRQHESRLRQQEGQLRQQETDSSQRDSVLGRQEIQLAQQETQLRQQESLLAQQENQLRQQEAVLAEQETQLRQQEGQIGELQTQLRQQEAQVSEQETRLRQQEAELAQRSEQPEPVAVGAEAKAHQVARPIRPVAQNGGTMPQPASVRGASRLEEVRAVTALHGRHDMERMAIRAVTDVLGNTITETVHERTRRSRLDHSAAAVGSDPATQLEQLRQENAELARTNGLLKAAAALLAAALDAS